MRVPTNLNEPYARPGALVPSTLTLWRERFLWTSPRFVSETSSRPALVLLIGPLGDIELKSDGHRYAGRCFLVNANVPRILHAEDAGLYSLHLDLSSRISKYLRKEVMRGEPLLNLSNVFPSALMPAVMESVFGAKDDCERTFKKSQEVLGALFPQTLHLPPIDVRVELVATWLWMHVPAKVDLRALAELSGLSPSRLAHLFTDETGISIKQYLLWVKMRRAVDLFVGKHALADVAHQIGFADSAHLSRTFKRYFSLKPSFLANPNLVRVQLCESRG